MAAPQPQPQLATASPIAKPPMSRTRKAALLTCGLTVCGAITWMTWHSSGLVDPSKREQQVRGDAVGDVGSPYVPIPRAPIAQPPTAPIPVVAQGAGVPAPNKTFQFPAMPAAPRPPTPIIQFQAQSVPMQTAATDSASATSSGGVQSVSLGNGGKGDALNQRLDAGDDAETSVATMLPDRNLFMTMGTPISCITEQPIRTDVPGPFRCKVKSAVYSTSGAVPLLDPGTWVFGRVAERLERGSVRAFGVVTRLETPQGCLVKLRAPIGDQLGTPGIDGEVDTHFWERFRGVALLALLDTVGQAAALGASAAIGNETGIQFNQFTQGTRQLGEGTVGDDINIPSTLATHQARNIVVMAMSDIDMRSCFKLRVAK
jgi:type IV secretion system protein VirB10